MPNLIKNPPNAFNLMSTAKSFGNYDLSLSLADIIDNSISAKASEIKIEVDLAGDQIRISDDGIGMLGSELNDAMQMASRDPNDTLGDGELGRFGLGMKTASFAQANKLSVFSKKFEKYAGASWDLEAIQDWQMTTFDESEVKEICPDLLKKKQGTVVIWERLDRLTNQGEMSEDQFYGIIEEAVEELGLIYHRFLLGFDGARKVKLELNGERVEGFDPFLRDEPATQKLPQESIEYKSELLKMTPYILPHYSKVKGGVQRYKRLEGREGFIKNSGFYVFRENRLIIRGTWFKITRHSDLNKLARISIDFPSSLDSAWKITVDKSDVQIPSILKTRLSNLVSNKIADKSVRVFKKRTAKIDSDSMTSVWMKNVSDGIHNFTINKDHPLISRFYDRLTPEEGASITSVLDLIEKTLPLKDLGSLVASNPDTIISGYTDFESLYAAALEFLEYLDGKGFSLKEQENLLGKTQPFQSSSEQIWSRHNGNGE